MSRSTVRALAWGVIAAQILFVVAWIVAGALNEGYSHVEEGVSVLGGREAEHPWIVNTAIVILGLSFVAGGVALRSVLPGRRARTVTVALFVTAGVIVAANGFLPVDCSLNEQSCEDAWRAGELSWQTDAHIWLGFLSSFVIVALPFAVAAALRPGPVSIAAFGAGAFGLVWLAIGTALGFAELGNHGVGQRIGLLLIHAWLIIVAAGLLHATRREPDFGRLVPIRPRDFVASEWRGEGELVLRPLWLWRRFAQRFDAHRTTTFISERVFRMDDVSYFGEGRSQKRTTYGEFVSAERLRITAGDLPDGAEVLIEDEGYRMRPFRMTFPLGPLPLLMRVRDESWVDGDGTFVNVFDAETVIFAIPLARLTFRVRPVEQGEGSEARAATAAS
jgi:hypothetical protein